jgi:hypothetical protein
MKSNRSVIWTAIAAVVVSAAGVMLGVATTADPPDPRSQTVAWAFSPGAGQSAMVLSVTSNAPQDKRIVTAIVRASDGVLIVGKESTSQLDPSDMGEPGLPLNSSETVLSLDSHPSGTAFTITSQFYDALGAQTGAKVTSWTKP